MQDVQLRPKTDAILGIHEVLAYLLSCEVRQDSCVDNTRILRDTSDKNIAKNGAKWP